MIWKELIEEYIQYMKGTNVKIITMMTKKHKEMYWKCTYVQNWRDIIYEMHSTKASIWRIKKNANHLKECPVWMENSYELMDNLKSLDKEWMENKQR